MEGDNLTPQWSDDLFSKEQLDDLYGTCRSPSKHAAGLSNEDCRTAFGMPKRHYASYGAATKN